MSIQPRHCPICGIDTNYVYNIEEPDRRTGTWYKCSCGVIFQKEFKPEYKEPDLKDTKNNQEYAVKIYAPIIEELTYGRHVLQPDCEQSPEVLKSLGKRGWITWGIDKHTDKPNKSLYKGDILTYPFTPKIKADTKTKTKELIELIKDKKRTFDLIWLQHYIERQAQPLEVLKKVYELLDETGVLFISTPDIDFIYKQGIQYYPYWRRKENNILFSERALKRIMEKAGFKVILSRRNFSRRFMGYFDIHMIAQKNYF